MVQIPRTTPQLVLTSERNSFRQRGSVAIFCALALVLLTSFAVTQLLLTQKNVQAQRFFSTHSELYAHAESGVDRAFHDLQYDVSGSEGNLGTANWTTANDTYASKTVDGQVGDSMPSIGELNVHPVSVGSPAKGHSFFTYVMDSGFAGVKRIMSTATDGDLSVTVVRYAGRKPLSVPITGALFAEPGVALDLNGSSFRIDGRDHLADGTLTTNPAVYGLATAEGSTSGENVDELLGQIPSQNQDQIEGRGGTPSVGEVQSFDFSDVFEEFVRAQTTELQGGTHTNLTAGDWSSDLLEVTYAKGNLHLSGDGSGAGILVVDGSLSISGSFEFYGLVVVRGDIQLTGGGTSVHIMGGVMVGESFSAIDAEGGYGDESPEPDPDAGTGDETGEGDAETDGDSGEADDDGSLKVSGTADVYYSSEVLTQIHTTVLGDYEMFYHYEQ